MKTQIYIVNGAGGSGKDTFEQYVANEVSQYNLDVGKTSIINYVKQIAEKAGWFGNKTDKDRKFLSDLKDALDNFDDSPFLTTKMVVKGMINEINIIFIDARSPKDIERLKNEFNAKTILIIREERQYGNHADDNVNNYNYDYIIKNTGTLEEFKIKTKQFCKEVIVNGFYGK